jgi:hypothetical protein
MKNRFEFRAEIELEGKKFYIPNVTLYADGTLGAKEKDFDKAIRPYEVCYLDNTISKIVEIVLPNFEKDHEYETVSSDIYLGGNGEEWTCFNGKPQQWTGFKSWNGEKLFEGDRVRATTKGTYDPEKGKHPDRDHIGVIEWGDMMGQWIIRVPKKRIATRGKHKGKEIDSSYYIELAQGAMSGSESGLYLENVELLKQ